MAEQEEAAVADAEYKQKPWWIVIARTGEFIAGARTDERYRAMEQPPAV